MKYLETRKADGKAPQPSIIPENKMAPGSRMDQRDPTSLISSPRASADRKRGEQQGQSAAKKLADDLGVDITKVEGTGPNGSVTEADVRNAKKTNIGGENK